MAATVVNYALRPFYGDINPGDLQRIKLYLQEKKYIDKEDEKLDISISNAKDIIDNFISITNKYGWGCL